MRHLRPHGGALLGALEIGAISSADVDAASRVLIEHLGWLFVPAGSAIVAFGDVVRADGLAVIAAIVLSTAAAVTLCGLAAGWEKREHSCRRSCARSVPAEPDRMSRFHHEVAAGRIVASR